MIICIVYFFLLTFLSLFYLTVFIFIYFFNIYIIFFLRILYLFMHSLISQFPKFQSVHYSNLHFIISNSHYKFFLVSSAVSVDSSPLETVSVPSLSLTSLKFTNWLVYGTIIHKRD